jgi:negative regulator of genetic competence, sporulation and motility
MDLIKISDSKLKIMLTHADMTHYELHNDSVSIADVQVRRALRKILADAREQTGFDADVAHLYVQMYPSADGGCELFISKPEEHHQKDPDFPCLPCPDSSRTRSLTHGTYTRDTSVYSFETLADLINLCKRLDRVGFYGSSDLYTDEKNNYYLFLRDFPTPSLYTPDQYCFLGEYGQRENAKLYSSYLAEYGRLLRKDDAVSVLSGL